jgi:hypothetical protein
MSDTITLSIRLPRRVYRALDERSKRENRSKNGMALLLLAAGLAEAPIPTTTRLPDSESADSRVHAHSVAREAAAAF